LYYAYFVKYLQYNQADSAGNYFYKVKQLDSETVVT